MLNDGRGGKLLPAMGDASHRRLQGKIAAHFSGRPIIANSAEGLDGVSGATFRCTMGLQFQYAGCFARIRITRFSGVAPAGPLVFFTGYCVFENDAALLSDAR